MSDLRLKILLGGNAILAESSGHEAEIFVPVIVNNRITLQNVVEQRRCCKPDSSGATKQTANKVYNNYKCPYELPVRQLLPLANSTPERVNQSLEENQILVQCYPTPEIVRRAVVQNKNISVSMPGLVPGLKIVRLHRVPTPNTPKRLAKIAPLSRTLTPLGISARRSQSQVLRNLSNVSSFRTPHSLHVTNETIPAGSPNQSFLLRLSGRTPGSATKWRKCITPQRTYIRRSNDQRTPLKLKRSSVRLLTALNNDRIIPDFRQNQTRNPTGDGPVLVKRRKLVIDKKLTISPRTFKHQLKNSEDLKRSNFQLPKGRREYINAHQTAFDLLTNSGYYSCIAKKLNAVFRKGCLNKRAETIMKYQQLTRSIPSIETR